MRSALIALAMACFVISPAEARQIVLQQSLLRHSLLRQSLLRHSLLRQSGPYESLLLQTGPQQAGQIAGSVRDSAGKPVAEVSVLLLGVHGSTIAETRTSADGAFVFLAIEAGTYQVKAEKAGFRETVTNALSLAAGEKKRCDVTLWAAGEFSSSGLGAHALSPGQANPASEIELDDTPHFTVAGITDSTSSGGHGSETRMRTSDALAKETLKLESEASRTEVSTPASAAQSGEWAQTREELGRALANQRLEPEREAELRRQLADLDEKLEDPLSAEHEYERAAKLLPSESNYFAWGAELLLHRATAPAIEVFSRGVNLHPDSARMLAGLGAALYANGSAQEAAQRLVAASDLAPADPAPYLFLGAMQEAASTPLPGVEEKLARFARQQPGNALANYYYALALWRRERGSENPEASRRVEVLLQRAAAIDPKLDRAYLQLGNLYFARHEFREALGAYQKAAALNSAGAAAHYRLGLTYKRMGDEAKARGEIAEYKRLDQAEAAAVEQQRRELRQFIFVLQDSAQKDSGLKDRPRNHSIQ